MPPNFFYPRQSSLLLRVIIAKLLRIHFQTTFLKMRLENEKLLEIVTIRVRERLWEGLE